MENVVPDFSAGSGTDDERKKIKMVVVGDGAVGKTCLLIRYCEERFDEKYVPTVFDNKKKVVTYQGEQIEIHMWDTAGQEEYDRLRPLSYPETKVFILVFSVIDPTSFANVKLKWKKEILEYIREEGSTFVLAGNKMDLRGDDGVLRNLAKLDEKPITEQQGHELAEELGAYKYIETSALENLGVEELFLACLNSYYRKGEKTSASASGGGSGGGKSNGKKKKEKKGGGGCSIL